MRHLDVLNLRGSKDHGRDPGRNVSDHENESDEQFDFGSTEEAEAESVEKSESGHESINRRKEPKSVEHGGDEANKGEKAKNKTWFDVIKGLKTEDIFETTNSDESENGLETEDSVHIFDLETPNQLKSMVRKGQQKRLETASTHRQTSQPKGSRCVESNGSRSASECQELY